MVRGAPSDPTELLAPLAAIDNAGGFASFVKANPGVLSDEMRDMLAGMRDTPAGPSIAIVEDLLNQARTDPIRAFEHYRARIVREQPRMDRLVQLMEECERALSERRFDDAIETGEAALEIAVEFGDPWRIIVLRGLSARALLQSNGADRSNRIERAIVHLESAAPYTPAGELRAKVLSDLAAAYGLRLEGDSSDNQTAALVLVQRALEDLGDSSDDELRATLEANLSKALTSNAAFAGSGRLAVESARRAVAAASRDGAPDQWAHCQINLGAALEGLAEMGEADEAECLTHYAEVVDGVDKLVQRWYAAFALRAIARVLRRSAERGEDDAPAELSEAQEKLKRALALVGSDNGLLRGQILSDLGDVQWGLGDRIGAVASLQDALHELPLTTSPADRRAAANRLGGLLVEMGEDRAGAEAYDVALAAAEVCFQARLRLEGRELETASAPWLCRWASSTFQRIGRVEDAVIALETGRARELRRRIDPPLALLDELGDIPQPLLEAYMDASAALRTSSLRGPEQRPSMDFEGVIREIRALDGHEDFAKAPDIGQIAAAAEPGWPLVYVNPNPGGLSLLAVTFEGDLHESRSSSAGSGELWQELFAGDLSEFPDEMNSYLGLASGRQKNGSLVRALNRLLPWLGTHVAAPILDFAAVLDAEGLTLVPCGPLCLAPLGCALLPDKDTQVLIDVLPVRFAPSAAMMGACIARGRRHPKRRLVAVGDPECNLPAAIPEVASIVAGFPSSEVRVKDQADRAFVGEYAPLASHLHLACHGKGGLVDFAETALALADGQLSGDEMMGLDLQAELVVASACQTAISQIGDLGDEAYSLSSALLAAGAKTVMATHWSIRDSPTAFLVAKLYDGLAESLSPAESLRRAQLWIRDASTNDVRQCAREHPELEVVAAKLQGSDAARPFVHPINWAAFSSFGA